MTELAIYVGLWFIGALIAFTVLCLMDKRTMDDDDFFVYLMISMF